MADLHFKESCPCGNSVDISGYESQVRPHMQSWHRVHDKHSNTIAKAVAESRLKPPYWPTSTWTNTFETTSTDGAEE